MRLANKHADAGRDLRGGSMLWTLIVLLVVFWALGLAFKVAAGLIHVLLVIAVVLFLVNLISGRKARV
jgi:uncharacterized membrane protein YtjA (UPF0391 family)